MLLYTLPLHRHAEKQAWCRSIGGLKKAGGQLLLGIPFFHAVAEANLSKIAKKQAKRQSNRANPT